MDKKGNKQAAAKGQQASVQPKRTDYPLRSDEVSNGHRCPVEVHEFAEIMRNWREQSSQSTALVR